jgi:hypothetical protein
MIQYDNTNYNQKWRLIKLDNGKYNIFNDNKSKCLSYDSNNNLSYGDCYFDNNKITNNVFSINGTFDTYYINNFSNGDIININSNFNNYCLGMTNENGLLYYKDNCNFTDNTKWKINKLYDTNYYNFKNLSFNKYLDSGTSDRLDNNDTVYPSIYGDSNYVYWAFLTDKNNNTFLFNRQHRKCMSKNYTNKNNNLDLINAEHKTRECHHYVEENSNKYKINKI